MQEQIMITFKFNDSDNDVEVFFINYATCSVSLNLHHMCSDVIMMKSVNNINIVLQALEKVHCLKQKFM